MFMTLVGILCVLIAVIVVVGFCGVSLLVTRDLAVIKDRLGFEPQPVPNKPESINEDINRGFDSGINFAFLCMYKMYIDGGMIIGDYDCVADQLADTIRSLLKDPAEYQKTHDMLTEYHNDKKDEL